MADGPRAGWLRRRMRLLRAGAGEGPAEPAAGGAECRYLAIIMDGNGRWAKRRGLPVAAGHRAGAKALRRVLEHALDLGIAEVTVYSFSTENWERPADEVHALMDLFIEMIESQVPDIHERGARVRFVGRREGVPEALVRRIEEAEALTANNTRMTLYIAFNYGARQELLDAAGGLAAEWAVTGAAPGAGPAPAAPAPAFTADDLRRHLYAPEMHDPELLIRTSGELRLSNFLLWQCAYAELYFSDALWPDFGERELDEALAAYAHRQRRFGGREPAGAARGGAPETPATGGGTASSADRQSAGRPHDGGVDA
ncbi:MAG TPA: polyprenyl diphosphate synthase [Thermoleophilia bacterium]|nr:polyprenyl diphosphate synthase [Thermoleophilia bacterium]